MTSADAEFAAMSAGCSLTLSGDFTLYGELHAVVAAKDVTVACGTLKAACERWSTILAEGTLTFGDDVEYAEINAPYSGSACGGNEGIVLSKQLYVQEPNSDPNWARAQHVIITRITDPCSVSFNMNGYGDAIDDQTVQRNCKATEPEAPTDESADFVGWYTEKECKNAYDFSAPVTGDLELFAKWDEHPLLGDVDGDGEVTILDATCTQRYLAHMDFNPDVGKPIKLNTV